MPLCATGRRNLHCSVRRPARGPIESHRRMSAERPVALVGGTIYVSPDAKPIPDGIVFIENGKVAAASVTTVPPNTETLDCSGATVLAGFCNSHVHFFERKW